MAPRRSMLHCPRCGEPLPTGSERCDSCGAYLVSAPTVASAGSASAPRPAQGRGGGIAFLLVGLIVGGLVGYALRSGVGPKAEDGGMPTGPADVIRGAAPGGMAGDAPQAGPQAGPGGAPAAMPAEIQALVRKYREALAKNPDDLPANIGFGNLLFDSGQWEKAIEHYGRALAKDPKNEDVRVDMAVAYHSLGQNDRAISELTRVTRENPSHKNAWLNLGVVGAMSGQRETAIRAWETFLKLEPTGERATSIRGELEHLKQLP